jgi:hypothetical protein
MVLFACKIQCYLCSGVVSHYFFPRWSLFLNALNTSMVTGTPFNQTLTTKRIFREVEEPFTHNTTLFPTNPQGNDTSHTHFPSLFLVLCFFLHSLLFFCFPPLTPSYFLSFLLILLQDVITRHKDDFVFIEGF